VSLLPFLPPLPLSAIHTTLTHSVRHRGNVGDEVVDQDFNFTNARRRSNSSSVGSLDTFKTKFEVNEPEPVFEENMGPENNNEEDKTESPSSASSVDENKSSSHKEM
jgi:hypothetical protein